MPKNATRIEIPKSISPTLYKLGFLISTAVLHIVGLVIGEVPAMKELLLKTLRLTGVIIGFIGVNFMFQQKLKRGFRIISKKSFHKILDITRLSRISLFIPIGNIGIIARKP